MWSIFNMIEREVEIKNINKRTILKKIKKIQAKLLFKGKQVNRVYGFKDKRLWNSNPKSCIRVRTEGKETIVTFWTKLNGNSFVKLRGHNEFNTTDLEETIDLLKNIGMEYLFPIK